MSKYLVFSHGFGVKQDSKGMFTEIANVFPEYTSVMFDYYIESQENVFTIPSLYDQAKMLQDQVDVIRSNNKEADITIICHSQGCVVAGIAKPKGIAHAVLLAPPGTISNHNKAKKYFSQRKNAIVETDGTIQFTRKDGSTSRISADFISDLTSVDPIKAYSQLSTITKITVLVARQDEMLHPIDFSPITSNAQLIEIDGDHNFTGKYREGLLIEIKSMLN